MTAPISPSTPTPPHAPSARSSRARSDTPFQLAPITSLETARSRRDDARRTDPEAIDAPDPHAPRRGRIARGTGAEDADADLAPPPAPPAPVPIPLEDVIALAAVQLAVRGLATTPTAAPPGPAVAPTVAPTTPPPIDAVPSTVVLTDDLPSSTTLTPLEQAVHDLIEQIDPELDDGSRSPEPVLGVAPEAMPAAPRPVIAATTVGPGAVGPREIVDPPQPTNPSHVHLVIDDNAERIVVTVAVRGDNVSVALRGSDDATAAALARNAGGLDHALRARGLDLASFSATPDRDDHPRDRARDAERDPHATDDEFSLEEIA